MADYTRILLRQGPDKDRRNVILKSGEPGYVTDYQRILVGDGVTSGGVTIGSKFLGFVEFDSISSEVFDVAPGYPGDFIFETSTNLMYVLSGTGTVLGKEAYQIKTNYVEINKTPTPDNINIFNNAGTLSLVEESIDGRYIAGYAVGRGLVKNSINPSIIELRQPSPELSFNANVLQITNGGVSNAKLASMTPNTVKARLNVSGPPDDISFDDLRVALGLVSEGGALTFGVPVGTIIDFAGQEGKEPPNYLPCDGRELPILDYFELHQALGNTWGSPSVSSFNIPNLNKRTTIGRGSLSGTGSSDNINEVVGSYGGSLANQLTVRQLPKHIHGLEIQIPAHAHAFTVTLPKFSGVYEAGNFITNGYNNYITVIGGNSPDAAPPTTPRGPQDAFTTLRSQAAALIKQNKSYIQSRTVDYVQFAFPAALSGNITTSSATLSTKCYRDSGYIIDSIAADLLNNANHRAVETGNLYFSGYINSFKSGTTVPSLPANQVNPTIAAIQNIGSIIAGYDVAVQFDPTYTNNGVLSSVVYMNPSQKVGVQGLRNYTNVIANSGFVPVTTPSGVLPLDDNNTFLHAASSIDAAKPALQQRVVEFVKYNFPQAFLDGVNATTTQEELSTRCFRDTGYIIDSIAADIRNNSNHRSIETSQFYFSGAVLLRNQIELSGSEVPTLPDSQLQPTIQAISAIGSFIAGYVMPEETGYTTYGVLSSHIYFTPSQNAMLSGFENFVTIISDQNNVPVTSPAGTKSNPASSYNVAANLIAAQKSQLQQQIVNYVVYNYPYALSSAAQFGIGASDITITNAGSGYTVAPALSVFYNGGVSKEAVLQASINVVTQTITGINVINRGLGYNDINRVSILVLNDALTGVVVPAQISVTSLTQLSASAVRGLSGAYFAQFGAIVDAIVADVRNAANHRSLEYGVSYLSGAKFDWSMQVGTPTPPLPSYKILPVVNAINAMGSYITGNNIPALPPEYEIITSAILSSANEGNVRIDSVNACINTLVYPMQNSGATLAYQPAGDPTSNDIALGNLLLSNKAAIQNSISQYIEQKQYIPGDFATYFLDVQNSNRDIANMIEAIVNDLLTGTNSRSIQYALEYWYGTNTILPKDVTNNQRLNTVDVVKMLRSMALDAVISPNNNVIENRALKKVKSLVATMVYPLQNNGGVLPYNPAGSPTPENIAAANKLASMREQIQDEVSNYVQRRAYLSSVSQADLLSKCRRDVGFMVDSIVNDLRTGVNAKSVQYALAYWNGSTSRLPESEIPNQRINTIDTIEYLISVVIKSLNEYGGILDQIKNLANTVAYPLINGGALPPYSPQGDAMTLDRDTAYKTLMQNRLLLQNDAINFVRTLGIISDRPDLQAKCFRDIGFMVDSVVNDLVYGTDARSIQYALAYWDGTVNRIGGVTSGVNSNVDQRAATIQTIRFLRDRSIDLVINAGGGDAGSIVQTSTTTASGAISYVGQTFDGANGDLFGIQNDPVGNVQPAAVVNKIIKVA